jgi:hypothetical protein
LWGAPRIHGELLKLGFEVAESTVSKYMIQRPWTAIAELADIPAQPCGRHSSGGSPAYFAERGTPKSPGELPLDARAAHFVRHADLTASAAIFEWFLGFTVSNSLAQCSVCSVTSVALCAELRTHDSTNRGVHGSTTERGLASR